LASYLWAALAVAALTTLLIPFRGTINTTTIGFAFLIVVLFVAILWGSMPAFLASALGVLSFNFLFLTLFTPISHIHDCRSSELGGVDGVLHYCARGWTIVREGKATGTGSRSGTS
jgi:hypothetical protein